MAATLSTTLVSASWKDVGVLPTRLILPPVLRRQSLRVRRNTRSFSRSMMHTHEFMKDKRCVEKQKEKKKERLLLKQFISS